MAEVYPSSKLPQPIRDNFRGSPKLAKTRIQMDDGSYFDRRRWTKQPFVYSLSFIYTFEQLKFFEAWFEYRVLRREGWFNIDIAGETLSVRPLTGEPSVKAQNSKWSVSFDVMTLTSAPVLPASTGLLPVWPTALPRFESSDYTYARANSYSISDIPDGMPESRQRFRTNLTKWTTKIYVDLAGRAAFWNFYRNTLADGLAWFEAEFDNGFGDSQVRAKFSDKPAESPLGAWFEISVALEAFNVPRITENEYNASRTFVNDYVEAGYVVDGYVGYYTD